MGLFGSVVEREPFIQREDQTQQVRWRGESSSIISVIPHSGSSLGSQLPYMEVHPEVADAVASGYPVVALETTIVTHGMPYPENLK